MNRQANQSAAGERVVLIVDDEEPNRQLLSALLSAQGYTAKVACDGPAALEAVKAGGIDLMLLDVMMPGMDGVEACQRIRKELGIRDLTIVFVTALSDRESRLRAKLAGADDFLVKPIDSFELTFRVANWMKLRSLRDYELCTAELQQRLNEVGAEAERLAQRVGQLAADVDQAESADRDGLARELGASAAELRSLHEHAQRPLATRIPSSMPPQTEPHAPQNLTRNQRPCP
jgi:CheY-like chemotaxis protein